MNMIDIVIIGQNEKDSIQKMLSSLKRCLPNARRVWVLDRCTDGSDKILESLNEFFVTTDFNKEDGRKVSSCRNLGLKNTRSESDVIFMDGDRFIKTFCNGFTKIKKDIVLFPVEDDERDDPKWFKKYNQVYGHLHNGFYSCGLYMRRSAINRVLDFQGELFDTSIEGYWGVEDVHLGDVCFHLGLTCDIYWKIRLNGHFDKEKRIPLDAWRARVKKRLPLNVIW